MVPCSVTGSCELCTLQERTHIEAWPHMLVSCGRLRLDATSVCSVIGRLGACADVGNKRKYCCWLCKPSFFSDESSPKSRDSDPNAYVRHLKFAGAELSERVRCVHKLVAGADSAVWCRQKDCVHEAQCSNFEGPRRALVCARAGGVRCAVCHMFRTLSDGCVQHCLSQCAQTVLTEMHRRTNRKSSRQVRECRLQRCATVQLCKRSREEHERRSHVSGCHEEEGESSLARHFSGPIELLSVPDLSQSRCRRYLPTSPPSARVMKMLCKQWSRRPGTHRACTSTDHRLTLAVRRQRMMSAGIDEILRLFSPPMCMYECALMMST